MDPKRIEEAALADVNRVGGWVERHPRLASALSLLAGLVLGYLLHR